jgi:hypothetical protein
MRDSMRMRRNLESLSLRLRSRCCGGGGVLMGGFQDRDGRCKVGLDRSIRPISHGTEGTRKQASARKEGRREERDDRMNQYLADGDGLLDEHVQVLGDLGRQHCGGVAVVGDGCCGVSVRM